MSIKNSLQKMFINLLVKNLYNAITVNSVVMFKKSKVTGKITNVYLGGRELDQEERNQIGEDARYFANSTIWKLLKNSVYHNCTKEIMTRSKTENDALSGKIGLWVLEVIDKTLALLKKI